MLLEIFKVTTLAFNSLPSPPCAETSAVLEGLRLANRLEIKQVKILSD